MADNADAVERLPTGVINAADPIRKVQKERHLEGRTAEMPVIPYLAPHGPGPGSSAPPPTSPGPRMNSAHFHIPLVS